MLNYRPAKAKTTALAVLVLAATAACGSSGQGTRMVELSAANFTSPADLANASDYVVTATFTSEPKPYTLPAEPALRYWVGDAKITQIIGTRPDAKSKLTVGMSIPIGTSLLNSELGKEIGNFSSLAGEYPTEEDKPALGDSIVAYLGDAPLAAYGDGFAATGQGLIHDGKVTMRAMPGELNHKTVDLSAATTSIRGQLDGPAPWRLPDPDAGNEPPPPTEGTPATAPTSQPK